MARLTTAECEKLVQSDVLRKVPDGGGLYLFIKGKGRAYWSAQFRNGASWSSKGFGAFPDVTPKGHCHVVGLQGGSCGRKRQS